MIQKAKIGDIKMIHRLLSDFAKEGVILPRPLSALYDHVRDYAVFREEEDGPVVGCCALQICWEDMAEIRSLAVMRDFWGRGIASELLEFCLEEANRFQINKVFVLTFVSGFFQKHGFVETDKSNLPQKIWADCLHCVHFPDCNEIAMIREVPGA